VRPQHKGFRNSAIAIAEPTAAKEIFSASDAASTSRARMGDLFLSFSAAARLAKSDFPVDEGIGFARLADPLTISKNVRVSEV